MSRRALLLSLVSLLLLGPAGLAAAPKKKVLLVAQGPDGHPKETHEYVAGVRLLAKLLGTVPDLEVTVVRADGAWKEGPDLLRRADAVVLFLAEGARWVAADPKRQKAFADFAARRGGLVALHWAIGTKDAKPIDNFLRLLGGCHGGPDRKYKVLEAVAEPADAKNPITTGIGKFRVKDEFYYRLKFVKPEGSVRPVLVVPIDGNKETVAWSWERPGGGRSFGFSGLHFNDNWRLPEYRRLVAQAILWTLKMPIPRDGLSVDVAPEDLRIPPVGGPGDPVDAKNAHPQGRPVRRRGAGRPENQARVRVCRGTIGR
jgi:type 1 glutamine amidotransferase